MSANQLKAARILIVDDEEANIRFLKTLLQVEGCSRLKTTTDSRQAAGLVREFQPDLILLDLMMPHLDGFGVMQQLQRVIPAGDYVPILVLTGDLTPESRKRALANGAKDFLTKPPDPDEALLRMRNLIETRFLHRQLARQNERLEQKVRQRTADLARAEAKYRTLVEQLPLVTYTAAGDASGRVDFISPQIHKLLGYTQSEWLASPGLWAERIHPDDRARVLAQWQRSRDTGEPFQAEYRLLARDGACVWAREEAAIERDADGRPVRRQGILLDITERQRAETALRELSLRLQHAQNEERRRIARELHDSTAQRLAAVTMSLGLLEDVVAAKDPKAAKLLKDSLAQAEQCSQEVRTLAYLLHPPLLDQLGLAAALKSYVEGFSKRSGIQIALSLPRQLPRFAEDIEITLFRIVQEALGNIHRHSGSATGRVRLAHKNHSITLEISDSGFGIPPATLQAIERGAATGIGLAGMRERLRQFGGSLEIASTHKGTTLRVVAPLQADTP